MFVAGPVGFATILVLEMDSKFGRVRTCKGSSVVAVGAYCQVQITTPAPGTHS